MRWDFAFLVAFPFIVVFGLMAVEWFIWTRNE
jgi:hypothetical protein